MMLRSSLRFFYSSFFITSVTFIIYIVFYNPFFPMQLLIFIYTYESFKPSSNYNTPSIDRPTIKVFFSNSLDSFVIKSAKLNNAPYYSFWAFVRFELSLTVGFIYSLIIFTFKRFSWYLLLVLSSLVSVNPSLFLI